MNGLALALGGALAILAGALMLGIMEWRLRRPANPTLRPRLSRPVLPASHRSTALRTFRWWGWAGSILLIVGGLILLLVPGLEGSKLLGIPGAMIASGLLAWTLGAGIGVVRAFDPPEHHRPRRAPVRRERPSAGPDGRADAGAAAPDGGAETGPSRP